MLRLVPVSLFFGMTGCATLPPDVVTVRGLFTDGREKQAFAPCGSKEVWWATGEEFYTQIGLTIPENRTRSAGSRWIEVRGRLRKGGGYGHLGHYDAELEVTHVIASYTPDRKPDGFCEEDR